MLVNDIGILRELRVGDYFYRAPPSWMRQDVAEAWSRFKIVGDTMGTWILKSTADSFAETINKKTMRTKKDRQGYSAVFYTEEQMTNKIFCDKFGRDIGHHVMSLQDGNLLRRIALMIGKELKE